jgi:PAS domain S-box-containing protein
MLKIVIALTGWFLLGSYLFYEYQEYGPALFSHLFSAQNTVQTVFHIVIFLTPFVTTYLGYLIYQKEELVKKVVTEKAKEDAILGAIGEGISIQDTQFKVLYQNQLHREMMGSHIGEYCYKAFQKREQVCEECHLAMTFKDGRTHKREQKVITDKGTVYLEITASPLTDLSGKLIAGIDVARDITERRVMEERLRQSEKKYRELVEAANSIILAWDTAGTITFINDFGERFFGFAKEELLGKNVMGTIVPSAESSGRDLARLMEEIRRDPDRFKDNENENITKEGRRVWVRWTNKAIADGQGTLIGILSIGNDITERRRAEEEKDRLAKAVSVATEGIAMTDEKDRYIYLNDAQAKIYGYLQSELIGKTWRDITPGGLVPLLEKGLTTTLHNRDVGVWSGECPGLRKDGAVISAEVTATARWNEKGDYLGHICVVRDITQRKRAEEKMRESEERFRDLFENATDLIQIVSPEGRILYVNRSWRETLGYSEEEIRGMSLPEIIDPACDEHCKSTFGRILSEGGVEDIETVFITKDGRKVYLEGAGRCKYEGGNPDSVRCIFRDVTFRKKAEEDRAKLEAQLLQAQKMEAVGQLAGGIAHDFNNMLTAIIGYASLLEVKLGPDSPLKPYVDQILSSSEKSANLTSQLLAFSRKQIMSPQETDLNELIKGMEMLLKSLIGEDVEFRTCFTDMYLMAMVDRGQIEQVLLNLCANARDAMPHGGLLAVSTDVLALDEKGIRTYDLDRPGRYALIAVTDTGHGMEETTRERIFEPFYTTKEIGKGTGLGLSIVYGIIRQHGGTITVYSEPGKGTTFRIFLPLIASRTVTSKKERVVTPRGGSEAILVAEDDEAVRTLASHILREAGYAVIEAVDGDDAINKFMENRDHVNLAMLDVVMPKKSGKEVSDAIRKIRPDMRVLLTSGYTADIISTKGITEEGLDFISKPITPDNLLRKVREVLDN